MTQPNTTTQTAPAAEIHFDALAGIHGDAEAEAYQAACAAAEPTLTFDPLFGLDDA
ncbi:hypothetical protein [Methylobacterium brachythecii]|uniref:Uncharacterized protein n=1 Tax=Methylobacterium brachythecii TaxID=1176177 RepID=A0A7W6AMG0_9HYPH|nr:hypothetical protein [Methylobacterium brachythecii]MBB3905321.1 hypothetical protein [Methylobacterium brachythecii]GLS45857.1 hypothetical protein GCM10007884_38480 [Methylobacterium brachythecii]